MCKLHLEVVDIFFVTRKPGIQDKETVKLDTGLNFFGKVFVNILII